MKVLLTGASGFVGTRLTKQLTSRGHTVLPVGRGAGAAFNWSDESLRRGVSEADAVIHLAGENLFAKRWSPKQKEILRASRRDSTTKLAALVAARKPGCFISTSAVGYYGPSETTLFHEGSPRGAGFLADLCGEWEGSTAAAQEAGVRCAIVRVGVVLGKEGGALKQMLLPFKLGLGGPLGNGKQWLSWVHVDDLTSLFLFLLETPEARGVFNGTAPQAVTMKGFARSLGRALHRPAVFPVPAPILRIAVGEAAEVLLTGQRVEPKRTLEAGFRFRFPEIGPALADAI